MPGGHPNADSDLDLFVVVRSSDQAAYRQARGIYRSLRGIGVPVEVVVQSDEEVERSRKVVTSLARKVMEEGRVLHGCELHTRQTAGENESIESKEE